jgi:hypothetical protein
MSHRGRSPIQARPARFLRTLHLYKDLGDNLDYAYYHNEISALASSATPTPLLAIPIPAFLTNRS